MSYIPYAISSKEHTGDIITSTQFEEDNLLLQSHKGMENCDKYDDDLTIPPLISGTKMDEMPSGDESNAEHMPEDMLEEIYERSQYYPSINRRVSRYKIRDII